MEDKQIEPIGWIIYIPWSTRRREDGEKSCWTVFVVPLERVKKDVRMKKDVLFHCALRMKEDDLELVWQRAAELGLAEASLGGLVTEAVLGKRPQYLI